MLTKNNIPFVENKPWEINFDDSLKEKFSSEEKIICVGCSISSKYKEQKKSFPQYLHELIQITGKRYQVINLSMWGIGLELAIHKSNNFLDKYHDIKTKYLIIQVPEFTRRPIPNLNKDVIENYCFNDYIKFTLEIVKGKNKVISYEKYVQTLNLFVKKEFYSLKKFLIRLKKRYNIIPIVLLYDYYHPDPIFKKISDKYLNDILLFCDKKNILRTEIIPVDFMVQHKMNRQQTEHKWHDFHLNDKGASYFSRLILNLINQKPMNKKLLFKKIQENQKIPDKIYTIY